MCWPPPAHVAAEMGVSRQTVSKWVRRFGTQGWDGLRERSSRPRTCPNRTPEQVQARVLQCRDQLRAAESTGLGYERGAAGDLVRIDVKKLGKIPDGGGWRVHGRSEDVRGRGLGYDYVHAAVDDHTRLAYAAVLPDEKGTTCAGFWLRASTWFATHAITVRQVMTDNAKNYTVSKAFAHAQDPRPPHTGRGSRRVRPQRRRALTLPVFGGRTSVR